MFAVTLNGWILSAHLLGAFALVGALTAFGVALVAARRGATAEQALALGRIAVVGVVALRAGLVAAAVFGVWLVFIVKGYAITNGWILGAIALWVAIGGLGDRFIAVFRRTLAAAAAAAAGAEPQREPAAAAPTAAASPGAAVVLFAGAAVAAVAVLALMVWKPGA